MDLAHALRDRAEDDLRRAAADVDDGDLPFDRMTERLGRAEEGEPTLLLLAEHLDLDPGGLRDLGDDLAPVLGLADRRRRDDADRLGAELLGEAELRRHRLGDLGDLLVRDLALRLRGVVDPRVGALLHDRPQLTLLGLSDEHPGRVRADVDRRAEHRPELVRPSGYGCQLNCSRMRGCGAAARWVSGRRDC